MATDREHWLARRVAKLEGELYKQRALKVKERECPVCGDIVRTVGHGRPRLYCSESCRRVGKLRCNRRLVAAKREVERGQRD